MIRLSLKKRNFFFVFVVNMMDVEGDEAFKQTRSSLLCITASVGCL